MSNDNTDLKPYVCFFGTTTQIIEAYTEKEAREKVKVRMLIRGYRVWDEELTVRRLEGKDRSWLLSMGAKGRKVVKKWL